MDIELVTIVVDDDDRAIRCFVDALGFDLVEDSPALTDDGRAERWVVVRPPGAVTGVLLARLTRTSNASATRSRAAWACSCTSRTSPLPAGGWCPQLCAS